MQNDYKINHDTGFSKNILNVTASKALVEQVDQLQYAKLTKGSEVASCLLLQMPQILQVSIAWSFFEKKFYKRKKSQSRSSNKLEKLGMSLLHP